MVYPAIHSYSFRDLFAKQPGFTVQRCIEMAAEMGFKSMEIMTGAAGRFEHITDDSPAYLSGLLSHAAKLGVKVHCWSTYNDFAFIKNEEWRQANIAYIKKWLKIAGDTNVPNIRMLTGYYGHNVENAHLDKLVADGIRECIPVAEKSGVNMAIENHSTVFEYAPEIMKLIAEVGSKRLTTCPDPSNGFKKFFDADCPAAEREAVYRNLELLAPKATNSHLKIKGLNADGTLIAWDIDRVVSIYQRAGYNGPITFESIVDGDLVAPLAKVREVIDNAIARRNLVASK